MIPKAVIQLRHISLDGRTVWNTKEYFQKSPFPYHILMMSLKSLQTISYGPAVFLNRSYIFADFENQNLCNVIKTYWVSPDYLQLISKKRIRKIRIGLKNYRDVWETCPWVLKKCDRAQRKRFVSSKQNKGPPYFLLVSLYSRYSCLPYSWPKALGFNGKNLPLPAIEARKTSLLVNMICYRLLTAMTIDSS